MHKDVNYGAHHIPQVALHTSRSIGIKRYHLLIVSFCLALMATLASVSVAGAQGDETAMARQTVQHLLGRLNGALDDGTVGEPTLVHHAGDKKPAYFIVPVQKDGRTKGLVGVSPDGRSWQWYTESYPKTQFPVVSESQAQNTLGTSVVMVSGADNKLYWTAAQSQGKLLSADNASQLRTSAQVQESGSVSAADTLPGKYAASEASDPEGVSSFRPAATTLPTSKNLSMPHYYQVTSYYCGPASLQMLFDHYNPAIGSQYEIADVANAKDWGDWSGAYADDLVRTARFSNLSSAVKNSELIGFKERTLGYGALANFWSEGGSADPDYATRYTDLKALVAGGHPVLMLMYYDVRHTIGHFRVLKGYDDTADVFIVHDPWYSAPYYGPDVHFKQSFLVDDLWTRYKRWAVTMSPWRVVVSAPSSVTAGTSFTVSATVRYIGPHPMEGRGPVTESQASLSVPTGFSVSNPTISLPSITASGTSQKVSWTVTASDAYRGTAAFKVTARGKITGSSSSYSTYTDYIGGNAGTSVDVQGDVSSNYPPVIEGLSPSSHSSAPGEWRTWKSTYSDANGSGNLRNTMILVNTSVTGENALYAAYSTATNLLYLRKADNSAWLPGVQVGTAKVLDNGYARLDAGRTTVTRSGNQLTVSWVGSAGTRLSGKRHNVYLRTEDTSAAVADWTKRGEWVVNRPATVGPVLQVGQVARTGQTVALDSSYSDPDGPADLQQVHMLINSQLGGAGSVWVRYDPPARELYLRNGDNSGWLGPLRAGASSTLANERVILYGAGTKVSTNNGALTVRWSLKFKQPFSGITYKVYSVAADKATSVLALPWVYSGSYSVSAVPSVLPLSTYSSTSVPGSKVTHTVTYVDPDGASHIKEAALLVNTRLGSTHTVFARYNSATNKLSLLNDAGTGWLAGVSPGSTGTVSNSQATLYAANTSVTRSGTNMVVKWAIVYKQAYSGKQYNVYARARDVYSLGSGWQVVGKWTVNQPPKVGSVSPKSSSSLAGSWVTHTVTYTDGDGAGNLRDVTYTVNSSADGKNGVTLVYGSVNNRVWLRKPDLSGWLGGVSPGTVKKLSTAYVTLDVSKTTVSRSGNTLTVRWHIAFTSQMKGRSLNQYMAATDRVGGRAPNTLMGTWTVK